MKTELSVIKIGGNVIDDSHTLHRFLKAFSGLEGNKILVHGGGKIATKISDEMGIEAKLVDGRRITDIDTLRIVTMVYAGLINKNMVAQLQSFQCNAIGLTGADGNFIRARKRPVKEIDYGYVGDIHEGSVNAAGLTKLLEAGFVPVFSALTHDGDTQLLNTNADTIASALAVALSGHYATRLVYCFEKKGVLTDVNDDHSVISVVTDQNYDQLKSEGVISGGMIPKLDNAFDAIHKGVNEVVIRHSDDILLQDSGTRIFRAK